MLAICYVKKFKKKCNLDASHMGLSQENLILLHVNNKVADYAACFSRGSVPVFLKEHIATCDFPVGGGRGVRTPYPPSGSAHGLVSFDKAPI